MRALVLFLPFFALLPYALFHPFAGIIMWEWIALMNPHRIVYGFLSTLPYGEIVAIVTFFALVISGELKKFKLDRLSLAIILYFIWMTVTSFFALAPSVGVWDRWSAVMKMLLFSIMMIFLTDTRNRLMILTLTFVLSIGFFGFKGFFYVVVHGGGGHVYGPPDSPIADNNDLGLAFVIVIPFMFYFLQYSSAIAFLNKPSQQRLIRWVTLTLIGMTFISTLFTYSRGAFIALCAMGAMLWLRSRKKVTVAVIILVAVVGVLKFAPASWMDRINSIGEYQDDASAEGRLHFWQIATQVADVRPFVGGGFHYMLHPDLVNPLLLGSNVALLDVPKTAHSIWFESLGEHGYVGLGCFLLILCMGWLNARSLVKISRGNPDLAWADMLGRMCQVSLVGYLVGGSFLSMSLYDGFYTSLCIGASARLIVLKQLQPSHSLARVVAQSQPQPQLAGGTVPGTTT